MNQELSNFEEYYTWSFLVVVMISVFSHIWLHLEKGRGESILRFTAFRIYLNENQHDTRKSIVSKLGSHKRVVMVVVVCMDGVAKVWLMMFSSFCVKA